MLRKGVMDMKTRYVKHVEAIPYDEFKDAKVFQSILEKFNKHSKSSGSDHLNMVVCGPNGELNKVAVDEIVSKEDEFRDEFSDGRCLLAVKLLWSDGTWEYGFKQWKSVFRKEFQKKKLVPMYARVGVIDDEAGKVVDDMSEKSFGRHVPAWMLSMIPMYNEDVKDACEGKGGKIRFGILEDWISVHQTMCSFGYVVSKAKWKDVPMAGSREKMAVCIDFSRKNGKKSSISAWKKRLCEDEFGHVATMLDLGSTDVFQCSYIKSIYCDDERRVREYKVIPISDVLTFNRPIWSVSSNCYEDVEVWNSLDETCKGNV